MTNERRGKRRSDEFYCDTILTKNRTTRCSGLCLVVVGPRWAAPALETLWNRPGFGVGVFFLQTNFDRGVDAEAADIFSGAASRWTRTMMSVHPLSVIPYIWPYVLSFG